MKVGISKASTATKGSISAALAPPLFDVGALTGANVGKSIFAWLVGLLLLLHVVGQTQPRLGHNEKHCFAAWVVDYLRQRGTLSRRRTVGIAPARMPHPWPDYLTIARRLNLLPHDSFQMC